MRSLLAWLLLASAVAQAQELSADSPPPDDKKLEWSGNLDAKYTLFHMAQGSSMYQLQFLNSGMVSAYLSQYRIEPYINADYQTKDLGFHLKTHATYFSDDVSSFDLFEAYGSFNPSFNSTLQAGKRVYSWGKGYAFNTVGYVNPVKDPENPELAQAGLLSANIEYIKSFSSLALQTFSFVLVVIPPTPQLNGRYAEAESTGVALKAYVLLWDTDIDVMGYYRKNSPTQLGFDFSRNLRENLEAHAELSYNQNAQRYTIVNGNLHSAQENRFSYLLGLRYLHESNTTVILEYYHNGLGMNRGEYENYADFLANAANSGNATSAQQALRLNQQYFRTSTLMEDYLYMKLTIPEPFDLLYFTPSLYSIYNLNDNGFLLSTPLSYKPVTNFEFIFWPAILIGAEASEFGQKMVQQRMELWVRVFF
jgi:opacity protein-like surface antigen